MPKVSCLICAFVFLFSGMSWAADLVMVQHPTKSDLSVTTSTQIGTFVLANTTDTTVIIHKLEVIFTGSYERTMENVSVWICSAENGDKVASITAPEWQVKVNEKRVFTFPKGLHISRGEFVIIAVVGDVTNVKDPASPATAVVHTILSGIVWQKGEETFQSKLWVQGYPLYY